MSRPVGYLVEARTQFSKSEGVRAGKTEMLCVATAFPSRGVVRDHRVSVNEGFDRRWHRAPREAFPRSVVHREAAKMCSSVWFKYSQRKFAKKKPQPSADRKRM